MLSKEDINKELGQGINIFPFNSGNIKENSINLSASRYAWSMSSGEVFLKDTGEVILPKDKEREDKGREISITKGKKATFNSSKGKIIILLPFSTTLIETNEVLAVDKNIAGTYHSKVGLSAQGIGHIGTMLGPGFSGHSLIALHNVSAIPVSLKVNDTFVSLIFNYLNTPIDEQNTTHNAHLDKMSELGITLKTSERQFLDEDWKKSLKGVRSKMTQSNSFKKYKDKLEQEKVNIIKRYLNKKNIRLILILVAIISGIYLSFSYLDSKAGTDMWKNMFIEVIVCGIILYGIQNVVSKIKPSN